MSMRISSALGLIFLLAACKPAGTDPTILAQVEANQRSAQDEDGRIVCAKKGSDDFARICAVDRESGDSGMILTVRHPDGAFHRLLVTKDGRGVIAADGAEEAKVTVIAENQIEVAISGDRYRLPATVRNATPAKP
ncbi:hypothetical protein BH09PSE4_BH09PSE4_06240 [soil metagenome]